MPARAVLDKYCATCHNARLKTAGLLLDEMDVGQVGERAEAWEKVARKLRTREMPPPGLPRPDETTYVAATAWFETALDRAAAARPTPGRVPVHRLNRTEYANAVRDLLDLEIDAAALLPPDDSARGFDNIAGSLTLSRSNLRTPFLMLHLLFELLFGHANGAFVRKPSLQVIHSGQDGQGQGGHQCPYCVCLAQSTRYPDFLDQV